VYLSLVLDKEKEQMIEIVSKHKSDIKRSLSKKIGKQVRRIPELIFHLDQGAEHAQHMEKIFKDLNIPPEDEV
jgi:ribosome-binding factor A